MKRGRCSSTASIKSYSSTLRVVTFNLVSSDKTNASAGVNTRLIVLSSHCKMCSRHKSMNERLEIRLSLK